MAREKEDAREKAEQYARKGQAKKAIGEYEKLLAGKPGDSRVLHRLAELWAQERDKGRAMDYFLRAAEAYQKAGFADRAAAVLKQGLGLEPLHLEAQLLLAQMLVAREFKRDAARELLRAAEALEKAGRSEDLLRLLERATELLPEDGECLMQLARALAAQGKVDQARQKFLAAAHMLHQAGRKEEFLSVGEKLLQLGETDAQLLLRLAAARLQGGEPEKSRRLLEKLLQTKSDHLEAMEMLLQCLERTGETRQALSVCKRLLRLARHARNDELAERAAESLRRLGPPPSGTVRPPPLPPLGRQAEEGQEAEEAGPGGKLAPPDLSMEGEDTSEALPPQAPSGETTAVADQKEIMVAFEEILSRVQRVRAPRPSAKLAELLEEADFYVGQGMLEEAERLLRSASDHPEVESRLKHIASLRQMDFDDTER